MGDAQVTLAWDPPASDSGVTRHEYRFKTGTGSYPASFTQIANSAVGGATSFTVTGLTNEVVHTFQLRAVNSDGDESAAAESNAVTPTPGICDRTQKVHETIVYYLGEASVERTCAEVNVADLAGLTFLEARDQSIASLKLGDFAGLTSLISLELDGNSFTTLPAGVLSGLTSLTRLQLDDNDLSSLPAGLLSGLTGLGFLNLGDNPNTGDTLALTVTVEKVGTDQVRAKVLAGAPFAVAIPVTVANGTLAGGVTVLTVAAGSVESAPVTVTRTEGTTAAVTVDVDLSTQPTLPTNHTGYTFAKATSGLPATILSAVATVTSVDVTSTPVLETDTYGAGERIEVTVTFSEAVNATSDTDFVLSVGGDDTRAPLLFGLGTRLVFSYTVRASDEDDDGIWIGNQDRTLVGDRMGLPQAGAITSVATSTAADLSHSGLGTDADHKVDGSRSIVSVAVSSTPGLETDTYGAGETIRFTVTFSSGVNTGGSPVFRFSLGNLGLGRQVDAAYESGAGSAALVFGYTVVSSDEDNDGIWIGHQGQTLVGTHQTGTITIVATSEAAGIEHAALGVQTGHKVDGSRTTGNNAPVFTSSASLSVEENTDFATVVAVDNDADDDITGYAITGGTDQTFFSEVTSAGVLTFNEAPNFEDPKDSGTDNTYVVTVEATSGTGTREMTATQTITVTVTDADEKSAKPDKPTLAKVTGSSTTLTATWAEPDLDGGPAIAGYAVQYREGTTGTWEDFAHTGAALTTTVTGLTADTSYQVQVRAKNGETDSDWSDPGLFA